MNLSGTWSFYMWDYFNESLLYNLESWHESWLCLQLLTVNSMVFTVKARDGDGDTITYMTDKSTVSDAFNKGQNNRWKTEWKVLQ